MWSVIQSEKNEGYFSNAHSETEQQPVERGSFSTNLRDDWNGHGDYFMIT